ncbi:MAG: DUF3046 domain-containing protein [Propionibacteriaceae bacterium]|jgi:hypothetical protein|nr:DUF3046 domain-containing protein [Propionibacteriaceae bacterium]
MRETTLWAKLESVLGSGYAHAWAEQIVLTDLGGRTVTEALAEGRDGKTIWRAVCLQLELPAERI